MKLMVKGWNLLESKANFAQQEEGIVFQFGKVKTGRCIFLNQQCRGGSRPAPTPGFTAAGATLPIHGRKKTLGQPNGLPIFWAAHRAAPTIVSCLGYESYQLVRNPYL
jgi:hypothetical protein